MMTLKNTMMMTVRLRDILSLFSTTVASYDDEAIIFIAFHFLPLFSLFVLSWLMTLNGNDTDLSSFSLRFMISCVISGCLFGSISCLSNWYCLCVCHRLLHQHSRKKSSSQNDDGKWNRSTSVSQVIMSWSHAVCFWSIWNSFMCLSSFMSNCYGSCLCFQWSYLRLRMWFPSIEMPLPAVLEGNK
jgi:hypothetical protein